MTDQKHDTKTDVIHFLLERIETLEKRIESLEVDLKYARSDTDYYQRMYRNASADANRSSKHEFGKEQWAKATDEQRKSVTSVYHDGSGDNLIQAIKHLRDLTGWGLRESKEAVDWYVESYKRAV